MKLKIKLSIYLIFSFVMAVYIGTIIGQVSFHYLAEFVAREQLIEAAASNTDVKWPWYYLLFNNLFFSIWWFLVGFVGCKSFESPYWRFTLIVPVAFLIMSMDIWCLLFVFATFCGGITAYAKSNNCTKGHITSA